MILSDIISTKIVPEVRGWASPRKQGKLNNFKTTPEDDLDTFCNYSLNFSYSYSYLYKIYYRLQVRFKLIYFKFNEVYND